ncbi:MAG: small redox-active disulfide protein 2 [Planctomycetota bacterium]|jgi:small redox-active disulfide protein 2
MHKIQILGTGCTKCANLTKAATAAADELGTPYELEKVTDFLKFADFGVMVTPALIFDGKVLVAGRVPKHEEMLKLLGMTEGSNER